MNIMAETPTIAAAPADAANILHAVEHIALSRLVPSTANVRRMNTLVGVSELADSIEAHGLIHNLTVRKAKKGNYEVVAGSRRLAALTLLAKEGRLGVADWNAVREMRATTSPAIPPTCGAGSWLKRWSACLTCWPS